MRVLVVSGSRATMPDPVYPLGAAIVATAAREAGHDVRWFDALRHDDPAPALARLVRETEPGAILFSVRNIDNAAFPRVERHFEDHLGLVSACRDVSAAPIVLGGSGFSLMPEAFMVYLGADCGVVGEGEHAVAGLLADIESGGRPARLVASPPSSPPFVTPDRDLFDSAWYYDNGGTANLQTKRGCELRCVYCTYPLLEGARVRAVEPAAVADEMERLRRSGIGHVFVVDSVFNRPETHAAAVCEEIIRRGLDISFTAYLVPQGTMPDLAGLLARAGCTAVELGTDSLSDPVLERLGKGFDAAEAIRFSKDLARAGIRQCHNLILGCPGETEETISESVRRMEDIAPAAVIVTVGLRIYPGTDLWRMTGGGEREKGDPRAVLEPRFYIEDAVAEKVVDRALSLSQGHRGWISPGLGTRYNARYLSRLRRRHKGPLWVLFGE